MVWILTYKRRILGVCTEEGGMEIEGSGGTVSHG